MHFRSGSSSSFCCSGHATAASPRCHREGRNAVQGNERESHRGDARRRHRGRWCTIDVPLAGDGERPLSRRHRVRRVRNRDVVFESVPARVRPAAETVPLRVLSEVHEEQGGAGAAPGQVHVEASARHRDLQVRGHFRVRGGRERQQDLLSEPVSVGQAVFGSQDIVLRRGAVSVLRFDEKR